MPETLSVADLRAHDICADQLALFRATFGEEAEVTEANMSRAVDVGLQIEWLEYLLTDPAWTAYKAAIAPARAEFEAACDQARAANWAAADQAWEMYEAARDQAWTVYRRALVGPLVCALRAEDGPPVEPCEAV